MLKIKFGQRFSSSHGFNGVAPFGLGFWLQQHIAALAELLSCLTLCGGVLYTGKGGKIFHHTSFRKVEMTDHFNFVYTIENIQLNTFGTFGKRIRMEQYDWINIEFRELPDFFLRSL